MRRQAGAALLVAMLLMAMVATAATASLWQHWRDVQVQAAEGERLRAAWVLAGALDWARGVLREDGGAGGVDHAGEPWAQPQSMAGLDEGRVLSAQIVDLQSRLNAGQLASVGRIHEPTFRSFERLFALLGLPPAELSLLAENLRRASDIDPDSDLGGSPAARPVAPQRLEHLAALGLAPLSLQLLAPYVTVLPGRTPLNLNTAGAEAIYAAVPGASLADAKRLVDGRALQPLTSLVEAAQLLGAAQPLSPQDFSVGSQFFEVHMRLRQDAFVLQDRAVVQRDGSQVLVLQRERAAAEGANVTARQQSHPPG